MKRCILALTVGIAAILSLSCSQTASDKPQTSPPASKPTVATRDSSSKTTQGITSLSFEGKTITMIVPFNPGGGTDILARYYATYLSKFLNGKPTIVVRNMPAGGGVVAGGHVYRSKPDGLTVLAAASALYAPDLFKTQGARYELVKMPVVLSVANSTVFFIKPGMISKPEDIVKAKGIIYGGSGAGAAFLFATAQALLNFPTERVTFAYEGSGPAFRAFISGEINMNGMSIVTYLSSVAPLVAKGEAMPLFQAGLFDEKGNIIKDPGLPADMPTFLEVYRKATGKEPSGVAWEAYKSWVGVSTMYEKSVFLPPETPANIVQAYGDAFAQMIKDPVFRKSIDPLTGKDATWRVGAQVDSDFKRVYSWTPEVTEYLRQSVGKYGVVIE